MRTSFDRAGGRIRLASCGPQNESAARIRFAQRALQFNWNKAARDYFAAVTMISTVNCGAASRACTVARAGVLPGDTQPSQTAFISAKLSMLASQIWVES